MNIETPNNADYCLYDDTGFVALTDYMGNDAKIVNAARVSFGKEITEVEEKDRKLLRYLLEHSHGSPLEHTGLTFLVKCPLFVRSQWMRHRVGSSFNEISGRYVEVKDEFYIPTQFRKQSPSNRQASIDEYVDDEDFSDPRLYKKTVGECLDTYKRLLKQGVAREQARGVLPQCTYTEFYWTCNVRSFLHFVHLRDHSGAQWEIQQYAKAMLEMAKEHFSETINIWESLERK